MTEDALLTHPIDVGRLSSEGNARLVADAAARARIAAAYGLLEVRKLAADAVLTPGRAGTVLVEGAVTADIVQACVVTLEPVEQSFIEPFSRSFVRERPEGKPAPKPDAEIMVDPNAPDPPEPYSGPLLDLGPIVIEHFLLGIDPYPRAPGATLPADLGEGSHETDSPFAALAKLRGEHPGND